MLLSLIVKKSSSTISILILAVILGFYIYYTKKPVVTWHMVDVNFSRLQGDANLIQIDDQVIMIDAGLAIEAKKSLIPYLEKLKIKHVDHFFVSHPHRDHYEGIAALWENDIEIKNLYVKNPPKHICDREIPWGCNFQHVQNFINYSKESGINVHHPKTGFVLELPYSSRMEILHAQEDDLPDKKIDVNDLSLIMKWNIYDFSVLFTGDLNRNLGNYLSTDSRMQADFLKIPHHGGRSLAPNSFFNTVSPDFALVPGPKWIWCGERGNQVRQWVYKNKLPHWVNGLNGHVRVEFNQNNGKVFSEKNETCSTDEVKGTLPSNLLNPYQFSSD